MPVDPLDGPDLLAEGQRPKVWIKPYYKSLNGLRGLAVLMVFFHHFAKFWHNTLFDRVGWSGVDLFFVLSGFLITGILYDSLGDQHYFRNFYIRRALRIFPVFYGFFLVLFLLTPVFHLRYPWTLLSFFFYFGNLVVPFADLAHKNPTIIGIIYQGHFAALANIGHLWSLCVEEQFYLLWPAVVWCIRDRRRLMGVCVIMSVLTLLGRCYLATHASPQEIDHLLMHWSTYTRCDTLLVGCWIALWLRGVTVTPVKMSRIANLLIWAPFGFLMLGKLTAHPERSLLATPFLMTSGYTFIALMAAGVLLKSLDEDSWLSRVLQTRSLSRLGVISYGFYFYHFLPIETWNHLGRVHPGLRVFIPLLAFGLTLALAMLSFRYYETPFLRLKKKLAPQHEVVATP